MNSNIADVIRYSFERIWAEFILSMPQIIGALLIVILGFILANICKSIVVSVFKKLNIDSALDMAGMDTLTEKAGYKLNSGYFVGTLVKWFVIIVFFVAALDILNLNEATQFLSSVVLNYLPQVIVSVLILFGGMILATFVRKLVVAGGRATSFGSAEFLGTFAHHAIIVFTALAVLNQLSIAPELVQLLFAGLVFGTSLAFGLAFGLGGKEAAGKYVNQMTNKGATPTVQSNHQHGHGGHHHNH